jgi:hypothetical protein
MRMIDQTHTWFIHKIEDNFGLEFLDSCLDSSSYGHICFFVAVAWNIWVED